MARAFLYKVGCKAGELETTGPNDAFAIQGDVRGPWRTYLDALVPQRPELYGHCCKLTGNIWDAEDLA